MLRIPRGFFVAFSSSVNCCSAAAADRFVDDEAAAAEPTLLHASICIGLDEARMRLLVQMSP
jgi:hypothetical protein